MAYEIPKAPGFGEMMKDAGPMILVSLAIVTGFAAWIRFYAMKKWQPWP